MHVRGNMANFTSENSPVRPPEPRPSRRKSRVLTPSRLSPKYKSAFLPGGLRTGASIETRKVLGYYPDRC